MVRVVLAIVVVLSTSIAYADDAPDAGQPDAASTQPDAAPVAKPDSMDFDLFGDDKKPPQGTGADLTNQRIPRDPARLAKMVKRRRLMLQVHQGLGIATLAVLAATCIIGQLNYDDKYGGGSDTGRYAIAHPALAGIASVMFATDASLALFAPTPYKKPIRPDAALAHKILMGVAAAGFLTQLILGPIAAYDGGHLNQRNMAIGHLVTGYGTFASMLGGYLSYVFK